MKRGSSRWRHERCGATCGACGALSVDPAAHGLLPVRAAAVLVVRTDVRLLVRLQVGLLVRQVTRLQEQLLEGGSKDTQIQLRFVGCFLVFNFLFGQYLRSYHRTRLESSMLISRQTVGDGGWVDQIRGNCCSWVLGGLDYGQF